MLTWKIQGSSTYYWDGCRHQTGKGEASDSANIRVQGFAFDIRPGTYDVIKRPFLEYNQSLIA